MRAVGLRIVSIAAVLSGMAGCTNAGGACTVTESADGSATIACPDGTSAVVRDGSDGAAGSPGTLVRVDVEAPGERCATGGFAIHTGSDDDGSGALDDGEIDDTEYACHGADGVDGARVRLVTEAPGDHCEAGGYAVLVGTDTDGDGTLDDEEVTSTSYVCHGRDGADGANAIPTLVRVVAEPAGTNCAAGGQAVLVGPDSDGSGTLDDAEVVTTSFACHGAAGVDGEDGSDAIATLVRTRAEPAGVTCPAGGHAILIGRDTSANGTLEDAEVTSTTYVCHGVSAGIGPGVLGAIATREGWQVRCMAWSGAVCTHWQTSVACTTCSAYTSCGVWHDVSTYNMGGQRTSQNLCAIATGDASVVSEGVGGTAVAPRACGWYGTHPSCDGSRATIHASEVADVNLGLLVDEGYCGSSPTLLTVECAGW